MRTAAVRAVYVSPVVEGYIVEVIRATRRHDAVELEPRRVRRWRCSALRRRWRAMQGRDFILPDDVKRMAVPTLAHRVMLGSRTRLRGRDNAAVVAEIVESVPVPVENAAR